MIQYQDQLQSIKEKQEGLLKQINKMEVEMKTKMDIEIKSKLTYIFLF